MNRILLALLALILGVSFVTEASAKRLKVYSYPKTISPGQMGFIVFENPDPEKPFTQAKCTAERLIAWVQSEIPILRIEQKGKQVWTSLGSYQTIGDSCIATFMAPVGMEDGPATLFLVNVRDASIPYAFTVNQSYESKLLRWLIRSRQQVGIEKRVDERKKAPVATPPPSVTPRPPNRFADPGRI